MTTDSLPLVKDHLMKNRLLIAPLTLALLVPLSACASSGAATPAVSTSSSASSTSASSSATDSLVGEWRMTTFQTGGEGNYMEMPYGGKIDFTSTSVSVQAMNPDIAAADSAYTVNGYEAFYGALSVDDAAGTFSVQVESALARALIGQTLTRKFEVSGDTLVLTPADPSEGWRVTYARHAA